MTLAGLQSKFEPVTDAGAAGRVPLARLLRIFWVCSLALFGLTLIVAWVEYRMGFPLQHYNPLGNTRYEDLMLFPRLYPLQYKLLHTAAFFTGVSGARVAYPPLSAVLYALIYWTRHPVGFYLGTAAVWLAAGVLGVRRELIAHAIGGVTATLFPLTLVLVWFPIEGLLQQGNIELFLWIFAASGVWAYLRQYDDAAAVLWGLAAAMKLYPVILLILLLPRRRWRPFAEGVATFVGATVVSLWWLGPTVGVAWRGSLNSIFGYQGARMSEWTWHELAANHSVLGLVKLVATIAGAPLAKLTLPYYAFGAVVMGLAFFVRLWKMPVVNQLLAVMAFMVMFPPISYFYTLIHLIAPFVVLVFVSIRAERAEVRVQGLNLTVMLFVPIFASFTLFTFPRVFLYGGLVQACLLLLLFGCALRYPFAISRATDTMSADPLRRPRASAR